MAKAQEDLQAQLDGKRRELAEVTKAATAETQAAVAAKSELSTVLDEQAAIAAVARERVASNKARVLGEQAAQLEAEISQLERRALEDEAARLKTEAESKKEMLVAQLWLAFEAAQATANAEEAAVRAAGKVTGMPYGGPSSGTVVSTLGDLLVRARVAEWTVDAQSYARYLKAV